MGKHNVADGDDRVSVQAGRVLGPPSAARPKPPAPDTGEVRVKNTRSGGATVGRQVDEVSGSLDFGGRPGRG